MANTFNGIMVKKFKNKIRLYYVNNIFDGLKRKIALEKNNFFLTSNLIIYLKFKKFNNFFYAHDFVNNHNVRKFYSKNIDDWHEMLQKIDLTLNQSLTKKNFKIKKNFYIASYMFRYFAFSEYCRIIFIKKCIIKFLKKEKIDQLIILGNIDLKYFNIKLLLRYLSKNITQEIILKNVSNNQFEFKTYKNFKNLINKKNIFLFFKLTKKYLLNAFMKILKKPSSLLVSQKRELLFKNNYRYYLLDDISKNNYKKYSLGNFKKIFINDNKIPKIFSNYLFTQTLELLQHNLNSISHLEKKFIKLKIENLKFEVEDINIKSYFSIFVAKLLNLKVIGYQHGSEYGINDYKDIDHNYICYRFADEFNIWGYSKFFNKRIHNIHNKKVKFLNIGSSSGYFLRNIINYKVDQNNEKIMFIPSVVRSDYFDAKSVQDPNWQIDLQNKIINFLDSKYLSRTSLSFPDFSYENCLNFFPIAFNDKVKQMKILYGSFKDNLLLHKPNILIFDRLSTALYEALNTNCKIIVFMDPLCIPRGDALIKLKKRADVIYDYKNIDKILNTKINDRIYKKNNEFKNSFYYN